MTYPIRLRTSALIIEQGAVLLIEFNDENGVHYNLPGGGVEAGESLIQAVKREALEEASVKVEVGQVAFIYEYAPHLTQARYGPVHSLTTIFACTLQKGEAPRMPEKPDQNQTGVKWIPLDLLNQVVLYPNIRGQIIAYSKHKQTIGLLEEHELVPY
ncbi:MAG: NUDIX domain-containing protein [Lysinibacillus sp.]